MRVLLALLLFLLMPVGHAQGVIWPSPDAPCNSSLQACINAQPANFSVIIADAAPTNIGAAGNMLSLPRSIYLAAAPGVTPVFPSGIGISSYINDARSIVIEGIQLRNAPMSFGSTDANASVTLRKVGIRSTTSNGQFEFIQSGSGTFSVLLEQSSFVRTGGDANPVYSTSSGGELNLDLRFNDFEVPDVTSSAYGVVAGATGTGVVRLDAINNRFLGSFAYGAVCGVVGSGASTSANVVLRAHGNVFRPARRGFGVGICAFTGEGAVNAYVTNNTLLDLGLGVYLGTRPFSPPAMPAAMSGFIQNNVIAYNQIAVLQNATASAIGNGYNLLFGNGSTGTGFTPDASTVVANPQLISRERPYLGSTSPAINQGNGLALLFAPGPALPLLDADGHRRLKNGSIDIGAYEAGDAWFRVAAPSSQPATNSFAFDHASVNGVGTARLQATATPITGTSLLAPFGVYRFGATPQWAMFAQDTFTSILPGTGFNLFAAASGGGSFLHQLASSEFSSQLNDSSVNGNPDAMVFVTSNWNPGGGSGVYNNHPTGVYTYADNNWYVQSGDGFAMPSGAAFNVYAQAPSPSVFRLDADTATIFAAGTGAAVEIPNDEIAVACAVVLITPWTTSSDDRNYDVYRRPNGRWAIYSPTGIPDGTRFNVMYSPRQVFECSGPLFADGFE